MDVKDRKGFIFYRSFYEAISDIEDDSLKLAMYEAVTRYGLDMIEPELPKGICTMCWKLIKPQMVANWNRFFGSDNPPKEEKNPRGRQRGYNNVAGGDKPRTNQEQTKDKPKEKEKEKEKVKEKVKEKEREDIPLTHTQHIPSIDDCRREFNLLGIVDETVIMAFFDYYNMRGWKTNSGIVIDDLSSCASNWLRREKEKPQPKKTSADFIAEAEKEGILEAQRFIVESRRRRGKSQDEYDLPF